MQKDIKSDKIAEAVKNLGQSIFAIMRNTHTSIAVVGASIISEDLRSALLSKMRPLSKKLEKALFEGYGPLSSFSSRIDMAFALCVVSAEIRNDLNTIRKIRNTFAHSKDMLNFTNQEIAELCKKLHTWDDQKTNFQTVYMERLTAISGYLDKVARKGQPAEGKTG